MKKDEKDWLHTDPDYHEMDPVEKGLYNKGWKWLAKEMYHQRKMAKMNEEWWRKNAGVSPLPSYKQQKKKIMKSSGNGSAVWPILKIVLIFGGIFFLLWLIGQMMLSINTGIP
ncbi:hypothetical protein J5U23_02901 [Saccharolobus shibatae B12]|uniref:Uncharacterized protein n=1 Tax=Saccharolobus shibatae (strain ATCC 51178 / DSM 5389 / JCM 8931 / NBRC 15437 / B12) TaxID=523848 RepID=A0A8F5BRA1_SACSH|nr:hypothetical protein [Saccharolobus shibatae]QXJ27119.1 hypothetical protein J5U23_p2901 [Saccharolobus shibatae B12]QXJ30012.1 hypothetical protein J5U23_02901 [Saccharolobus shibatae B12]